MKTKTYTHTVVKIHLDDEERFAYKRLLVDTVSMDRGAVTLSGYCLRFGRPTGRRPGRDREPVFHVGDYRSLPFEVAKEVERVACSQQS